MHNEDMKYFSDFLKEFQSETDRGAALVGAALIDERLERLLLSHLIDCKESKEMLRGGNAPLAAFNSRIKMAYCVGLLTDLEYSECNMIRKIRNEFAHKVHGLTFQDDRVRALCNKLLANTPDGKRFGGDPRQLFINSVILTSLALWYRPEYNEGNRAKLKQWKYQLST